MKPKNYKRGYPVAVLVGIEQDHAALWHIFSQVAKQQQTIPINGDRKDSKALYSFHETIINALRPVLKEGVRSIVVASPPRTSLCPRLSGPHQSPPLMAFAGNKQSIHLADNRFRKLTPTSGSFNQNIWFQTVNPGKRRRRNRKPA